jgi:3-oxoacyl-[acyl-carrier protein] reductase
MAEFFRLDGQTALVTGAGRGIGAGIARRLHAAGARVAIFDRDSAAAAAVAKDIEGLCLVGDVRSQADVFAAVEQTEQQLGSVSILVNNAGITGRSELSWKLDVDEVREVFEVNLVGPFLFCKAVVPLLLARGYGRIVNVASIAGKEGNPTLLPYSSSKAALIALTKSLAKEMAGNGDVTANAVSPAVVRTEILAGVAPGTLEYMISRIPLGRTGTIEEVAALVHFLASPESSFTTGQCYDISGGRATY